MIDTAIILAGGRGSRLAPWPAPKCILPVLGVPIIDRLIEHVAPHVGRIIVCTGYRAKDVETAIRHRGNGHGIAFSNAGEDAEMGRRLLAARAQFGFHEKRVLVCYGDEISDVAIDALQRQHEEIGALLTFAAFEERLPFGVVRDSEWGGHVIDDNCHMLVNIGFVLAEPSAWKLLKSEDGLTDWINRLSRSDVSLYRHTGRRAAVNSIAELQRAEEVWAI